MSKIDQKKYVFDILKILFPEGQYVQGKKEEGEQFVETLKKANPDKGRRSS